MCHGLLQAQVELGFGFVALANDRSLAFACLEIGIRARCAECVIGKARGHKQVAGEEDRRQGNGVDHPVADASDDLEKRAFPGGASSHGLRRISF